MTITTNRKYNFDAAENEEFSWDAYRSGGGLLIHKPTGRGIYKMHWLNADGIMADPVTGAVRENAIAFWDELDAIKREREAELFALELEQLEADKAEMSAYARLSAAMDDPNSDY